MKTKLAMLALVSLCNASIALAGGSPPIDASFTVELPPGAGCDFPTRLEVTGKVSFISLPGDRLFIAGPDQFATVTNLDVPNNSVTLVSTAIVQFLTDKNGNPIIKFNGRGVVVDPPNNIFVFLTGSFSSGLAGATDLAGNGQVTDICTLID